LWMVAILIMSGPLMSAENTGGILGPVLGWLGLGPATGRLVHGLVRKSAHVTEYAVLGLLWRRAFIRAGALKPAVAAALALAVSVGCAVADETHQSFLTARTGALSDVVLDSFGAMAAVAAAHVGWWRAAHLATGVLLWVATVGGVGMLALDLTAGAGGGVLWITVPTAALLLVYRWRRSTSRA
jgi:VanZ family protein